MCNVLRFWLMGWTLRHPGEQHAGGLEQVGSDHDVTAFGDSPGPITALAFHAAIDEPIRFRHRSLGLFRLHPSRSSNRNFVDRILKMGLLPLPSFVNFATFDD